MSHAHYPATPFTSPQSLPKGYRAIVIGATGAIGSFSGVPAGRPALRSSRRPGSPHQPGD